jgi:hypothetical protein
VEDEIKYSGAVRRAVGVWKDFSMFCLNAT